jgi:hypothetical protein
MTHVHLQPGSGPLDCAASAPSRWCSTSRRPCVARNGINVLTDSSGRCACEELRWRYTEARLERQSPDQSPPQSAEQSSRPWWQFPVGRSGNPSGRTRTQVRAEEFFAEFRSRHGREPSAGEAAQIRLAAKLAAKFERTRGEDEDLARMAGHLMRALRRLGLEAPIIRRDRSPYGGDLLKRRPNE